MTCETHGGSVPELEVPGAMSIPDRYCERGLLHRDYEHACTPPHLNAPLDPFKNDGTVSVPDDPGLGVDRSGIPVTPTVWSDWRLAQVVSTLSPLSLRSNWQLAVRSAHRSQLGESHSGLTPVTVRSESPT